jgi:hypothetical protein
MFKTTISILCALLALVFLGGCANREDTDSNSVIRKQENDHQIHGEAGAYYGRSG